MRVSRRTILRYGGFTGIALATGGIPSDQAHAQTEGRYGLGLCIGLNALDPIHYYGNSGLLRGCVPDAKFMSGLLRSQGFLVRSLWDRRSAESLNRSTDVGTIANVERWIKRAAAGLRSGDTFVVTYSGHGSHRLDGNGDEGDRRDETWCLYDGQMLDDDRAALWAQFQPGVRIVVISDSCHSGTAQRVLLLRDAFIEEAREAAARDMEQSRDRGIGDSRDLEITRAAEDAGKEMARAIQNYASRSRDLEPGESFSPIRKLPDEVRDRFEHDENHKRELADRQRSTSRAVAEMRAGELQTRVLAIGACQDNQTAGDLPTNGIFTARLKQAWNQGGSNTYQDFFNNIRRVMPDHQTPNLDIFGPQLANFENQRPFTK